MTRATQRLTLSSLKPTAKMSDGGSHIDLHMINKFVLWSYPMIIGEVSSRKLCFVSPQTSDVTNSIRLAGRPSSLSNRSESFPQNCASTDERGSGVASMRLRFFFFSSSRCGFYRKRLNSLLFTVSTRLYFLTLRYFAIVGWSLDAVVRDVSVSFSQI